MKKPTIHDVARAAGVSISTVSRVMNDDSLVKPQTREAVLAAIASLSYRPGLSARVMSGKRSYWVALLYQNPGIHYIHMIQQGAMEACRRNGYMLSVHACQRSGSALEEEVLGIVDEFHPVGLILTPPLSVQQPLCNVLRQRDVPFVRIAPDEFPDTSSRVFFDERAAMREVTQHLIAQGHRRIAFIAGLPDQAIDNRRVGFIEAMEEAGLKVPTGFIGQGHYQFDSTLPVAEKLLNRKQRPTAIIAASDDMGAACVRVAHQLGLSVPGDVSITGFDNSYIAHVVTPRLTSMEQPARETGQAAAELIIAGRATPASGEVVTLPHRLVAGQSTGPAPD